jgi:septal ring factor EnvC (AmiA/AmiB activator)
MNKLRLVAPIIGSSFLLMGLSMPSCPMQLPFQKSVDELKASEAQIKTRLAGVETSVNGMKDEMTQLKDQITQLANVVLAQKTTLEELSKSMSAAKSARPRTPVRRK